MQPRTFLMLLVGFVGGLIVSACSPAATCTPATCGGCCDSSGKCQSGATPDFCGSNGVACAHCGTGTICQQNECRAGSTGGGGGGGTTGGGGGTTGGGGGTTGGGGGTTGGGTGGTGGGGGCRMITILETAQTNLGLAEYRSFSSSVGHYNYAGWIYLVSGANPDSFRMEVVYPGDNALPSLPYTETFSSATRYANCRACAIFYESCDPQTTACQKEFLGQAGSMTINRADRASAGRVQGSAANVRFNEWDLRTDTSAGPGCIIVNTIGPWDIGWNADGGALPP